MLSEPLLQPLELALVLLHLAGQLLLLGLVLGLVELVPELAGQRETVDAVLGVDQGCERSIRLESLTSTFCKS